MKEDILFLDANVLFSAAYREDSGILKLWKLDSVKLVSSTYAIEEARRNLDASHQKERLQSLLIEVEECLPYHKEISLPENIALREKDIPILLAAIFIKADYLITGDVKDFGKFYGKKICNITILTPADYLKKRR